MRTRKEIRDNLRDTTGEIQIDSLINDYINISLQEVNDPGWAFEKIGKRGYKHNWSFLRRKTTFSTVTSTEFYQLPRDLDKINHIRQTTSPVKLKFVSEELFYRFIPDPTATGNPLWYRLWEEEGLATRLSTDDTVKVVSDSTSDSSSFTVSIVGYDSNDIKTSEVLTLNGTSSVAGTITWKAGRPIRVSKSGTTTGTITISEVTSGDTILLLGKEERSPRFKIIGLYPIPSSGITITLEYYTRLRRLQNDADVPDMDEKWIWVVRLGVLTKIYQFQEPDATRTLAMQSQFERAVRSMVTADLENPDNIEHLTRHLFQRHRAGIIELADGQFGAIF